MAKRDTFVEGNVLRFNGTFTDEITGDLIDPSHVAFGWRVNGGPITIKEFGIGPDIVRQSVGQYYIDVDSTSRSGVWVWQWQSTGTAQALTSGSIAVTQAAMSLI